MLTKNETISVTITDLTKEGIGVGHIDGLAVFVANTLPGETVSAKVIKTKKHYAVARKEALIIASPARVASPCASFPRCGGCTMLSLAYPEQLKWKQRFVTDCFKKFAHIDMQALPTIPSPKQFSYRNKTAMPVSEKNGSLCIGFYAARSHEVIHCPACVLSSALAKKAVSIISSFLESYHISAYNESSHKGLVRHILVREAHSGSLMIALVLNGKTLPHSEVLVSLLTDALPTTRSILLNHNTEQTNIILGKQNTLLYGEDYLTETLLGIEYEVSLHTFLQVNHAQAEQMLTYVKSLLGTARGVVVDLFSGMGAITLALADSAEKIYGIEIVPQAVENAKHNAEKNHIANASFYLGDCEKGFLSILEETGKIDTVVVDPPRKGLSPAVISDIAASQTSRIIYISCDPSTLARDVGLLKDYGYFPLSIQPFDMFPNTGHVETVVLLSRADAGSYPKAEMCPCEPSLLT